MSPARVVALLVGGQGVLHTALQLLGGTAGMCNGRYAWRRHGCDDCDVPRPAAHLMTHPDTATSHGSVMSLMSGGHLVMLLAHLAAAVAVGVWLAAGERALWMLLALTARPLVDAWGTVTAVARGRVGALVVSCPRLQPGCGHAVGGPWPRCGPLVLCLAARPSQSLRRMNLTSDAAVIDGLTADTPRSASRPSADRRRITIRHVGSTCAAIDRPPRPALR